MSAADSVLLIVLCGLLGGIYAALWQPAHPADTAEVRVDGTPAHTLDLRIDQVLKVEGTRGLSTVAVSAGRVRFLDSPCRNRICIHSGWLSHAGDGAACVPNRVSISLVGKNGVDSVAF